MIRFSLLTSLLFSAMLSAQTTVVVSTDVGNVSQEFYSLNNGTVSSETLASWDLAFEITGITGSIRVNTAKGMAVYKAPYTVAQWEQLDTTGLVASWSAQQNSETSWSSGALNQGLTTNPFDLGWGIYNQLTHNITGDSLFVLKLADGSYKKLRIDNYSNSSDAFTLVWADLDGQQEQTGTITRADYTGMNFGYYDLATNSAFAYEPLTADWDLTFTKYVGYVTQPYPTFYPVVGCLQNRGISVLQVDGVAPNEADWSMGSFSADMDVVGHDWKTFNMETFMYEYAEDRTYFVQDRTGNIWKLIFTAYGGAANGDMTFTQELVSAVGVEENTTRSLVVYPNPASTDNVNIILDRDVRNGQLSIIDATGKLVRTTSMTGAGFAMLPLDLSGLANGTYVLRLVSNEAQFASRIMIAR